MAGNTAGTVETVRQILKDCKADVWAWVLKEKYLQRALRHLEDTKMVSVRKIRLAELAGYGVSRDK